MALAEVAKAAIVAGNDHRSRAVSQLDLERMCESFVNVQEPFTREANTPERLAAFLIRTPPTNSSPRNNRSDQRR